MGLRKHQQELSNILDGIIDGSPVKKIICECTPGAGKSLLPVIAARKLLSAGLADSLCWIVPRRTLQRQGEANFQDIFFRKMLRHNLNIRSNTNEEDPCRGLDGFITTYQAIGIDKYRTVLSDIAKRKYILVLDENQHVEKGGVWEKALKSIVYCAEYIILMTGTSSRGNGTPIAFMDSDDSNTVAKVVYGRKDALKEKAILPLHFSFSDGTAKWIEYDGREEACSAISKVADKDVGKAIFTAISTDFAEDLMKKGLSHWNEYKKRVPSSRLLIVAANVDLAKKALSFLSGKYRVSAEIATSHDSAEAEIAIRNFKAGRIDILVGVAMFYEGFDCPQISHIIALTNIRTREWLEQMFARAVRINPDAGSYETQRGYIFAPDDPSLRKIVSMIEAEQRSIIKKPTPQIQTSLFNSSYSKIDIGSSENIYGITPVESFMTKDREITLGATSLNINTQNICPKTPSEIETDIKKQIEKHVRLFSHKNRYNPKRINIEIMRFFEKPRSSMTISELSDVLDYVRKTYPLYSCDNNNHTSDHLAKPRGCGKRVPTKARSYYAAI